LSKKARIKLLATNAAAKSSLKFEVDEFPYLALWECKRERTFALYQYES